MDRTRRLHLFAAVAALSAAGLFHFATPVAISAQGRASIPVSARVVSAAEAWAAWGVVASLQVRETGTGPMLEFAEARTGMRPLDRPGAWEGNGLLVTVEPRARGDDAVRVTVAHVGL
ncbi:MAG: hypothetical protein RQ751_11115 [Longimicrobiales bacterium]|nr:hypothetical protein [Longimicrobiales bacterium]